MSKKPEDEEKGGLPGWMGTYGDLVTLLLCFFILLFSMSTVDATKYKAVVESFGKRTSFFRGGEALTGESNIVNQKESRDVINRDLDTKAKDTKVNDTKSNAKAEEIEEKLNEYITERDIESDVHLSHASNYIKITISGEYLFDSGEASIKPYGRKLLLAIMNIITSNEYAKYTINIAGHTDNLPINTKQYPSNWYLSSARAIAVGEWLITNCDYNPEKVACTGYGEYKPIDTNDTEEGRARNRRVEFKLILDTES